MASVYAWKGAFQGYLRPWAKRLVRWGATANQVTTFTLLLCVLAGAWVWYAPNLLWFCALPGVYLLRMALNAIDGLMAKEHGQASRLGAFWNELADLLGDAALYAAFVRLAEVWLVVLLILLGWLSEVAGILGWAIDGKRRNDGPMGKSDRALWLGLAAGLTGLGARSGARWVLIGVIVLCTVTIYNRMQRRSL